MPLSDSFFGGVPATLTLILLQKHRDTNGRRAVAQIGGVNFHMSIFSALPIRADSSLGGFWSKWFLENRGFFGEFFLHIFP